MQANLVICYVRDPVASAAFYRDLLGLKVKELSPHWAEFEAGGISLALHPHPAVPAKREATLPWVVFTVDDVFATYERLKAKGAKFEKAPVEVCGDAQEAGMSADLEDPDGNRISLFSMVPRARLAKAAASA